MKKVLFILIITFSSTIVKAQNIDSLKTEQTILKDSIAVLQAKSDGIQATLDIVPEGWDTFGKNHPEVVRQKCFLMKD